MPMNVCMYGYPGICFAMILPYVFILFKYIYNSAYQHFFIANQSRYNQLQKKKQKKKHINEMKCQ